MNDKRRGQGTARVQISAKKGRAGRRWRGFGTAGTMLLITFTAIAMILPGKASQAADPLTPQSLHEITWIHPSPAEVRSFVIFVSPEPALVSAARQIDVGKPGGSSSTSAQFFSAIVPVSVDEYVAVAAMGQNGLLSVFSEWRPPQPTRPGQPLLVEP